MRIKLNKVVVLIFLCSALGANLMGYPAKYGPFPAGQEPTALTLYKCDLVHIAKSKSDDIDGEVRLYSPQPTKADHKQFTLTLRGSTNGWEINLHDTHSKNLLLKPFTNGMTTVEMEVYTCDLNGDGQPDFIVNVWSGGCGLAAGGSEVTFLLSGKNGYQATSFYLYAFGNKDLVRFKPHGPVYFIFNDLISSDNEKTRDGRLHNFWVYELKRIDGNRFVAANSEEPGFPKWIWFTDKDNHQETTQLSQEQKNRLLIKKTHQSD